MNHHPSQRKTNMNTKNLTRILTVTAAAVFPSHTLNTAEPFLSPRVMGDQNRAVPGATVDGFPRELQASSPKGWELATRDAQAPNVPGGGIERDLVSENRNIAACPRTLEQFPWLAQRAAARTEAPSQVHPLQP